MTSIVEYDHNNMIPSPVTKLKALTADNQTALNAPIPHSNSFEIPKKATPSYLKKIDELIAEMKGKSLNVIIENGLAYEISLQRDGRKLIVEFKYISEDKMRYYTDKKIEVYGRMHGLWTAAFQGVGSLIVGAVGLDIFILAANKQTIDAVQIAWQGIGKGIDAVSKSYDNKDGSDQTSHGFHFEINRDTKSEYAQRIQQSMQASQDIEHRLEAVARIIHDLIQRLYS